MDESLVWWTIGVAGAVAIIVVWLNALRINHDLITDIDVPNIWRQPMGKPTWDFTKNWATNITAIGAIFAAILAIKLTSANPPGQILVLSALAALLVLIGPLVYNSLSQPVGIPRNDPQAWQLQGSVWLFLVSAYLTLWGVLVQLAALGEYAWRLSLPPGQTPVTTMKVIGPNNAVFDVQSIPASAPTLSPSIFLAIELVLAAIVAFLIVYTIHSTYEAVNDQIVRQAGPRPQPQPALAGQPAPPPARRPLVRQSLPTWTAL